ncbi:hypothetical protein P3T23_000881 [Paraburkholderia sp. GAS448]
MLRRIAGFGIIDASLYERAPRQRWLQTPDGRLRCAVCAPPSHFCCTPGRTLLRLRSRPPHLPYPVPEKPTKPV